MKINDPGVNVMTTADDTDIIPIARASYPYPASITVKNIKDAITVGGTFSGLNTFNTTIADSLVIADPVAQEVNGIHTATTRTGLNVNAVSSINAKINVSGTSNCTFYGASSILYSESSDTANYASIGGAYSNVTHRGSGNVTVQMRGMYGHLNFYGSGTVAEANGLQSSVGNNGAGTITVAKGLDVRMAGTGTTTTAYGVYIGTLNASTAWGIYVAGAYKSYFGGGIRAVVSEYADNAAALAGGLAAGDIYRTGDDLKIVH